MDNKKVIEIISKKGDGNVYLGVVGAVRTGKSTFIKKFIETLVIPNMDDEIEQKRCLDELPQSAGGKTIMTIEPKFVPSSGAKIKIDEFETNVKLIDCVGYVIDESKGYEDEEGNPRMVKTPWYDEEIPFIEAADIGTEKVIKDHSTIGIVMTTDGTIGEISRNSYEEVEDKVINELKSINKPFIVIMNTVKPNSNEVISLCKRLEENYEVPVIPISVLDMQKNDVNNILKTALYEFPIEEINVNIPDWIDVLKEDNIVKQKYITTIKESIKNVDKLKDVEGINLDFKKDEYIEKAYISNVDYALGEVTLALEPPLELYDNVLKDIMGVSINSKADLLRMFEEYKDSNSEYEQIKNALKQAKQTGYGVALPSVTDMILEKPEVIKQGGRYGVKLKAKASSIHMIKVDVTSAFEPIIGSEAQSKELIDYIMKDEKENPGNVWKSEIFGRSLDVVVSEGIQSKINTMSENTKQKLEQTVTKLVDKETNNLITIVI